MSTYRYATGGQAYTCLGWHADVALLDDVDSMSRGDHIIWVDGSAP